MRSCVELIPSLTSPSAEQCSSTAPEVQGTVIVTHLSEGPSSSQSRHLDWQSVTETIQPPQVHCATRFSADIKASCTSWWEIEHTDICLMAIHQGNRNLNLYCWLIQTLSYTGWKKAFCQSGLTFINVPWCIGSALTNEENSERERERESCILAHQSMMQLGRNNQPFWSLSGKQRAEYSLTIKCWRSGARKDFT